MDQSLYRRFRPQAFGEIVGQPHLVQAMRSALSDGRVRHAYLLSGPRGTGKTSTARILAKALNCTALTDDAEPCGACTSCESVAAGRSFDLIEMDAASNNSVEHIRSLVQNAGTVSPGQHKVYLLDEVHMLSTAASNALLKTLEEPPSHVIFILATTDPQKVLPTIRSRTQHLELGLVGAEELSAHVREIASAAELEVDDEIVNYAVSAAGGSVRDALSALDAVVAGGGIPERHVDIRTLVEAIATGDLSGSLLAVNTALAAGANPRDVAERTAQRLRNLFLVRQGVKPSDMPASEIDTLEVLAKITTDRLNVAALEAMGTALAQMASVDQRIALESNLAALFDKQINRSAVPEPLPVSAPEPEARRNPPDKQAARQGRADSAAAPEPPPVEAVAPEPAPEAAAPPQEPPRGGALTVAALQARWADDVVAGLNPLVKAMYGSAQVLRVEDSHVMLRLDASVPYERALTRVEALNGSLGELFGKPVKTEVLAHDDRPEIEPPQDEQPESDPEPDLGATSEDAPAMPSDPKSDMPGGLPPASDYDHESFESAADSPHTAEPAHSLEEASSLEADKKIKMITDRFPGTTVRPISAHDPPFPLTQSTS